MPTRLFALAFALTVTVGSPAAASNGQENPQFAGTDPNEKICEDIVVTGSRLAKKRFCATRAQWEERKQIDRRTIHQIQTQIIGPCQIAPASRNGGPTAC
jgi:hypothetical protein